MSIESNNEGVPWGKIFDPDQCINLPSRSFLSTVSNHPELTIEKVGGEDTWVQLRFAKPVICMVSRPIPGSSLPGGM